jgi:hypothetical protein
MVLDASGYTLQYSTSADFTQGVVTLTNVSTVPDPNDTMRVKTVINKLNTGTLYFFRVLAIGVDGFISSDYSSTPAMAIPTAPPVVPKNFRSTGQAPDSVTLAWDLQGGLSEYLLQYKIKNAREWTTWAPAPGAFAMEATVTGLVIGKKYDFRLTAINAAGQRVSKVITAIPKPIPSPVKPKVSVIKKQTTISSVTLKLPTTVSQNATYIVHVVQMGTLKNPVGFAPYTVNGTRGYVEVFGLIPNTTYKFSITAVNEDGKMTTSKGGLAKTYISAKTATYTAVTKAKAISSAATSKSVTLTWTLSSSNMRIDATRTYEILWWDGKVARPVSDIKIFMSPAHVSISGTTARISGLEANKSYTFVICEIAKIGTGFKSLSTKVTAKTSK